MSKLRSKPLRNRELAIIHAGKKKLGLSDDNYRELLHGLTGKHSAADLNAAERKAVIAKMEEINGGPIFGKRKRIKPAPDKKAMISKVWALLYHCELNREYAEGTLKRMFKDKAPAKLEWATGEQLYKLIAALEYHKKRHFPE